MSKFRVGDEIELRVRVREVLPSNMVHVAVLGNHVEYTPHWMDAKELAAGRFIPRPIKVGDRVSMGCGVARVVGLDGERAWIKWDGDGSYSTRHTADLEPVND